MAKRLGEESRPCHALHRRQALRIMEYLESHWAMARTLETKRELAAAAVTHLTAWLGWLRSLETFSITHGDVQITPPSCGQSKGLP